MTDIKIKGAVELQNFLNQLPAKIEANIMRGALRAGAKPIVEEARKNAPVGEPSESAKIKYKVYAGALRDSIRLSARINRRDGNITASIKAGGKVRRTGATVFYAHFSEFGTRPHSLSEKGESTHPGTQPKPFMRPALDGQSEAAIQAACEYIKRRLATKHGINTADIDFGIEADE